MTLPDVLVILAYFALVMGVGMYFAGKASRDLDSYFLGNKRINWITLAMSGAVSNFDVTGTMWMVSVLYLLGMKSWWHHWMWGVMLPAFGMAYMAGWVRRSGVLTGAEWMITRFGDDAGGKVARIGYAIMAVITCASFVGYAFQGIGKFAVVYVPLERLADYMPLAVDLVTVHKARTLAVLVLSATTLYVVAGGLFGVVVTDVIQTVILTLAGIMIAAVAFVKVSPEMAAAAVPPGWENLAPVWRLEGPAAEAGYAAFGFLTLSWVIKGLFLNAGGPGQMYDFQRYLAARDPRDAAKIAAAWPFFLVVRWAMVAGIALLALAGIGDVTDPEMVMPMVLSTYLPPGIRGLVIAGLLAAFMSTFSSTANSGASYVVRDIWQPLAKPGVSERALVRGSYLATVAIVAAGMVIGWKAESIASIWGWIMMALGGAVIVPNLLRWHWWRINGWGYAAGTAAGIILSAVPLLWTELPVYHTFAVICAGSALACALASVLTRPTDRETLAGFYRTVRPFGAWGPVKEAAGQESGEETPDARASRPVFNTVVACAGITGLYIFPMYLVGHWYIKAAIWAAVAAAAAIVLHRTWYRTLPPPGR